MIKHIVLFKLKTFDAEIEKAGALEKMKNNLLSMEGKIDELKYIEVGINCYSIPKNYDLAFIAHFNSLDDLEAYRVHPAHQKVVAYIKTVAEQRAFADYEYEP